MRYIKIKKVTKFNKRIRTFFRNARTLDTGQALSSDSLSFTPSLILIYTKTASNLACHTFENLC